MFTPLKVFILKVAPRFGRQKWCNGFREK